MSSIRGLENSSKLSAITVKVLAVERKVVAKIYENKVKNSILINRSEGKIFENKVKNSILIK